MTVTDDVLRGLCAQAFNLAKLDLERGRFNFLLASYHHGERLHRMTKVEKLIIEKCGQDWLNNGAAKDVAFGLLRIATTAIPPDALVFASVTNMFRPTEKFHALDQEAKDRLMHTGPDAHHRGVREGLFTRVDALVTLAQTPLRVCQYFQECSPRGVAVGPPDVHIGDQSQFDGRLKFFGKPSPESYHNRPVEFWKKKVM